MGHGKRPVLELYAVQINHFIEAKAAIDPVSELALKRGNKKRLAQIYTIMGAYHYRVEENFSKAFKLLEEALTISEEVNDIVSLLIASTFLGEAQAFSYDFKKAHQNFKKALDINTAAKSLWGMSAIQGIIAFFYYHQGKINLAYRTSNEAIRLAEESGDVFSQAIAYSSHGIICLSKRFLEEAKSSLLKGFHSAERINYFPWIASSHFYLGEIYLETKEYQKAIDHYDKVRLIYENSRQVPSLRNFINICIAKSKVLNNEKDINLEQLFGYAIENKIKLFEGTVRRSIAEILLNMDDQHTSDAKDWIEKAIETDTKNGTMFYLGMDYAFYSELFRRKSDLSKARENLNKAIEIFKECGADGWVKKYAAELAALK